MYPPLISALIYSMGLLRAFPTRQTSRDRLERLLEKLRPLTSGRELIRLGPEGDGGYVLPDDLAGIEACFSPGVSGISGFEQDCAERGMKVFLADRSVSGPACRHELFTFTKKFVGATTDDDFMTLDEWVTASLPESTSDLLLQIDVEGCEYEVFLSASDALLRRFRIIVVEFHFLDHLWSEHFFRIARPVFDKLLQTHACVHIHPNNGGGVLRMGGLAIPPVMEFTFQRRDRLLNPVPRRDFPCPLDRDNTPHATVPLPACWYHGR
jgi:hypothetical protein